MLFSQYYLGLLLLFCVALCKAVSPVNDDLGDIPADILNLLLSPGILVSQMNISLSVLSLLLDTATMDFDAFGPIPLIELTVDNLAAEIGTGGQPFFSFNQSFSDFILPGLSTVNSGTIPDVQLTQGGLATLNSDIMSATSLDIISAVYSLRVLTVNGTGGIPLTLPLSSQIDVPSKVTFGLV